MAKPQNSESILHMVRKGVSVQYAGKCAATQIARVAQFEEGIVPQARGSKSSSRRVPVSAISP
jgi:ribosomal protein S3